MSDIPLELRPDYILGYAAGLAAGRLLPSIPQSEQEPVAYFSYGEDSGYVEHSTAAKAKASAQADIDAYRKEADQEWPDGIDFVCWGIVLQEARIVNEDDDSSTCDYALAPLITTHPAPQPAEVRAVSVPDEVLTIARDALDEIALAGMSGSGQESEDGMRDWHARQAWKFISIAAQAKCQIDAALAEKGKA